MSPHRGTTPRGPVPVIIYRLMVIIHCTIELKDQLNIYYHDNVSILEIKATGGEKVCPLHFDLLNHLIKFLLGLWSRDLQSTQS